MFLHANESFFSIRAVIGDDGSCLIARVFQRGELSIVLATFLRDIAANVKRNLIYPGEERLILIKASEVLVDSEKYFLGSIPRVGFISQQPPRHPHYPCLRVFHDLVKSHQVTCGRPLNETSQQTRNLSRNIFRQPFCRSDGEFVGVDCCLWTHLPLTYDLPALSEKR